MTYYCFNVSINFHHIVAHLFKNLYDHDHVNYLNLYNHGAMYIIFILSQGKL